MRTPRGSGYGSGYASSVATSRFDDDYLQVVASTIPAYMDPARTQRQSNVENTKACVPPGPGPQPLVPEQQRELQQQPFLAAARASAGVVEKLHRFPRCIIPILLHNCGTMRCRFRGRSTQRGRTRGLLITCGYSGSPPAGLRGRRRTSSQTSSGDRSG